jgi:hypothetical protein
LELHSDEDRVAEDKRNGDKYGVTTGLNVTHFTNELFWKNYQRELDDDALADILAKEFPNRRTIQRGDWKGAVAAYRGYFNGGQHGHGPYSHTEGGARPLAADERLVRFKSQAEIDEANAKKEETAKKQAAKKQQAQAAKQAEAAKKEAAAAKAAPRGGAKPAAAPPAPAGKGRTPAAPKAAGRPVPAVPARRPAAAK